uniref:TBC1 domain family, member 4 n=1 Tax=Esox lucius TaxID=8010 RepID=A0A3P8XAM7_ESOLU
MDGQNDNENKDRNLSKQDIKRFALWYIGWSSLDRRTTLPMLPWLVAEIRRKSEKNESGRETGPIQAREVQIVLTPPFIRCVPSNKTANSSVFIFEHKAQFISRFIHNSNDLTYFAYLIRSQPDNPESEMACHVFRANDPNQVPEVISSIRAVSKSALKENSKPKQDTDEAFYNSQKFEVLYCGKVTVANKKASSTIIDDCIDKFHQHELERKRLHILNDQGSTGNVPMEFIMGDDVDPLSTSTLIEANTTKLHLMVVSNSPSLSSLRAAFPECILEDSGFEEQQEFRARCSSLAGSLQRKSREGALKAAPPRRRHASAPNHVQPSDADKNRTMLFQVGRFEVNLISPDSKTVVLEKKFKDISSCSQGINKTDHFGFVCRDSGGSGPGQYVCYVFQCACESLVDEVMLTLKQAFSTAAALQSAKTQVKLCEACPMHDLHKLCERIEGLYPPRAKLAIQKFLSQLTDKEQVDIFERVQRMKPASDQEENELVILQLRQLCGTKQKSHLHIGEHAPSTTAAAVDSISATGGRFKLDILKNKAKTSLTSSLENIFSRGANRMRGRLGSMGSFERADDSPGDSPPGTPPGFPEDDTDAPQFRRRAHTFSHPPVKKRISFTDTSTQGGQQGGTQSKVPLRRQQSVNPELLQSSVSESESTFSLPSSTPTFLKSFYQGSLGSLGSSYFNPTWFFSNGDGRKRTLSGCSSDSVSAPLTRREVSWRQKIFLRVATPINKTTSMQHQDHCDMRELLPLSPRSFDPSVDPLASLLPVTGERPKRTRAHYRALWKTAIHQQILLLRMEKENKRLEASRDELHIRKMKLDYQEVGACTQEVQAYWDRKLSVLGRAKLLLDKEESMTSSLSPGVPKGRRGEVWLLFSQQHRLRHRLPPGRQAPDTPYQDLLKQLTAQQHSILVDLGRTFPTHQYFSAQLGAGQLSLYNLLKAYSLLDTEVGYCQGISFVAGILLLHMSEDQAFDMLKFLMYDLGFRRQYRPDMTSLQYVQIHCLTGLPLCVNLSITLILHTCHLYTYRSFSLSSAIDILFVQGNEVIFKVALCLLSSHEGEIVECDSFEAIVDYLKTTIPNLTPTQMEETISKVLEMDISKQLHTYEVEYHVLQDEMVEPIPQSDESDCLDKLEKTNNQLKKQNMDLLEKLQVARQKIQSLEATVENFLSRESKMKHTIRSLEQERQFYQKTIERMRSYLPLDTLADMEMTHMVKPAQGPNGKAKPAANKP